MTISNDPVGHDGQHYPDGRLTVLTGHLAQHGQLTRDPVEGRRQLLLKALPIRFLRAVSSAVADPDAPLVQVLAGLPRIWPAEASWLAALGG